MLRFVEMCLGFSSTTTDVGLQLLDAMRSTKKESRS